MVVNFWRVVIQWHCEKVGNKSILLYVCGKASKSLCRGMEAQNLEFFNFSRCNRWPKMKLQRPFYYATVINFYYVVNALITSLRGYSHHSYGWHYYTQYLQHP